MQSKNSNRNNLGHAQYYQLLADVIGVFWEFHKKRVSEGNIPTIIRFTFESNKEFFNLTQYAEAGYKGLDVIYEFAEKLGFTLDASWNQFLLAAGVEAHDWSLPPIPESCKKFTHPYVRTLIEKIDPMVKPYSKSRLSGEYNGKNVVGAGLNTGSEATAQLAAIFKKFFHPSLALMISKVRQEDVDEVFNNIGFKDSAPWRKEKITFDLIHPVQGLDRARLKSYGLGDTLGCPAGMRISQVTRQFLINNCGVNPGETMLADFANFGMRAFQHYIIDHYEGMSDQKRRQLLDSHTRNVLSLDYRQISLRKGER